MGFMRFRLFVSVSALEEKTHLQDTADDWIGRWSIAMVYSVGNTVELI